MKLIETFKKQGGIKLINQYWKSGALATAIGELFLLGKSRTSLEILRLSAQLKAKQKLEKKYKKVIEKLDAEYDTSLSHESSKKVWVCWFQGIENAPEIVKKCYDSLRKNISDREIVLITYENLYEYVSFPDFIQRKIDEGIIKGAHLSDLLRLELLLKYGGTWIDATVFCSGNNIPSYMLDSELFMFQCLKPGRDGHCTAISNWFITASSNNKLLYFVQQLLYLFWKDNDAVVDYFIFHIFFQMCIDSYPHEWKKVVPFSNSMPHVLLLRLNDEFDSNIWKSITSILPFHKLSYKNENMLESTGKTFYDYIMEID